MSTARIGAATMRFAKFHGCGNDYVLAETWSQHLSDLPVLARAVSQRRTGIGSDGLILVGPASIPEVDWRMRIFNADGSEAQLCGNGLRCAAKFVYEAALCTKTAVKAQTGAGVMDVELRFAEGGSVEAVRVNIGPPRLRPEQVPTLLGAGKELILNEAITIAGQDLQVACVSVGNPHAIVFRETQVSDEELFTLGPALCSHSAFPEGVNVHFVTASDKSLQIRTWERGSGWTQACGSGACAVAVAWQLLQRQAGSVPSSRLCLEMEGGELVVEWNAGPADPVFMEGPATFVFAGDWELE